MTIMKLPVLGILLSITFVMSSCAGAGASDHYDLGVAHLEQGRWEEAIVELDEAVTSYGSMAQYRRRSGDLAEAKEIERKRAEGFVHLSTAHTELGQHELAVSDLDRAIGRQPEYALAYANRALAHTRQGSDTEAEQDVAQAEALGYDVVRLKQDIEALKQRR
jgi:tetratricopeptide (TPR) repeat protein